VKLEAKVRISRSVRSIKGIIDCSEVVTPQVELNGAVGEAWIGKPPMQCRRTKLIFVVRIDDPFLD